MGGPLIRLGATLLAVYVGWTLLNAYAGTLFLLCATVAGWRLWRTAATMPGSAARAAPSGQATRQRRHPRGRTNRRLPPLPRP